MLEGIDPLSLTAGRANLVRSRLQRQRRLDDAGIARWTPIEVTRKGVVYDGNHAVRVAAERGRNVVAVVTDKEGDSCGSIMNLPVTER